MPSILIVDDDTSQLNLFRLLLSRLPYTIFTAQNAAHALSVLNEENPDLVLLDIAMPNVNGLQLLHVIRADPHWAKTKVIILTAAPFRVPKEDAAEAYRVLAKPFDTS